jgi:hypothetical protein
LKIGKKQIKDSIPDKKMRKEAIKQLKAQIKDRRKKAIKDCKAKK